MVENFRKNSRKIPEKFEENLDKNLGIYEKSVWFKTPSDYILIKKRL